MSAWEAPGQSDEWYTPAHVFEALGVRFDLDVAAPSEGPRHVPAARWLWHDGLEAEWRGFVWMNPPFGRMQHKLAWLEKFNAHGDGIALLPDRTSAPWFQRFAPMMQALLFVSPKLKFERADGSVGASPGTGTVLMARGWRGVNALHRAQVKGLGLLVLPAGVSKEIAA